jgi:proteasome lid subunit RPN8/RPN11
MCRLQLDRTALKRVIAAAQDAYPEEACGLLLGAQVAPGVEQVWRALRCGNAAADRLGGYSIAPLAYLDAERLADAEGLRVIGVWHSHPTGCARPSALDRRDAWPGWWYLIVGWRPGDAAQTRLWRLPETGESPAGGLTNGFFEGVIDGDEGATGGHG